jgi:hypothetical protein
MARKRGSNKKRGAGPGSRVRDAITGQFRKRGTERRRPKTTVVERIKRTGKKR